MCGICGAAALTGSLDPAARHGVRAMAADMAYRGPDGDGFFDSDRIALGHRRLAIIDRAGGASQRRRLPLIVFNGEVYNHRTCARCSSPEDTYSERTRHETILHAWESTAPTASSARGHVHSPSPTRVATSCSSRDRLGKNRSSTPC